MEECQDQDSSTEIKLFFFTVLCVTVLVHRGDVTKSDGDLGGRREGSCARQNFFYVFCLVLSPGIKLSNLI